MFQPLKKKQKKKLFDSMFGPDSRPIVIEEYPPSRTGLTRRQLKKIAKGK